MEKLGLPAFRAATPATVKDINAGTADYDRIAYVQLDLPNLSYRHVLLCLIVRDMDMPFLLGSADQAHMHIVLQTDSRSIRIGTEEKPLARIPFMEPTEWKKKQRAQRTAKHMQAYMAALNVWHGGEIDDGRNKEEKHVRWADKKNEPEGNIPDPSRLEHLHGLSLSMTGETEIDIKELSTREGFFPPIILGTSGSLGEESPEETEVE